MRGLAVFIVPVSDNTLIYEGAGGIYCPFLLSRPNSSANFKIFNDYKIKNVSNLNDHFMYSRLTTIMMIRDQDSR
jgi:hypothetical protein